MRQIAIPLHHVFDTCRFHKERIVSFALDDSLDTLGVGIGEDARTSRFHEGPHALVGGDVGILREEKINVFWN